MSETIKQYIFPLCIWIIAATFVLVLVSPAHAQTASDIIRDVGDKTSLPSYDQNTHSNASIQSGASNITSAILYAADFLKYIMGGLAIMTIIISGIRLVTGGKQIEEVANKQKEHLKYAIIGLVIIIVADQFVLNVFYGQQGEIFGSQSEIQEAATRGSEYLRGIYSAWMYFAGSIAVLMIVVAGFRYVTSAGNEEVEGKSKKRIAYAVVGLLVLGIGEFVVKDIVFPNQGSTLPDVEQGKRLIVQFTNFISGFISTLAFIVYIYAGYLYVTAFGNEDATSKAKNAFIGATIGLLLAAAAFGIVNTVIKLEPLTENALPGTSAVESFSTNP